MSQPLSNKIAFVTGGSRGIGAAIVKRLARDGATVAFTYLNNKDKADQLVADITKNGGKAVAIQSDSGQQDAITAAVKHASATLGKLDIVVNNAGVFITGAIDNPANDLSEFDRQYAINVKGVVAGVRAAVPLLNDNGRIISIGSVAAETALMPGLGDYGATKAALGRLYARMGARFSQSQNYREYRSTRPINTDMNPDNSDMAESFKQQIPLNRYGTPDEIAAAVSFLASSDASYITGTTLTVDGGFSS